jgi:hypothetical protein
MRLGVFCLLPEAQGRESKVKGGDVVRLSGCRVVIVTYGSAIVPPGSAVVQQWFNGSSTMVQRWFNTGSPSRGFVLRASHLGVWDQGGEIAPSIWNKIKAEKSTNTSASVNDGFPFGINPISPGYLASI